MPFRGLMRTCRHLSITLETPARFKPLTAGIVAPGPKVWRCSTLMQSTNNVSSVKRGNIYEVPRAFKQARRFETVHALIDISTRGDNRCGLRCHTDPPQACICRERAVAGNADLRNTMAQIVSSLTTVSSFDTEDSWPAAAHVLIYLRAEDQSAMTTHCPRALHSSMFVSLMDLMMHNDTQATQAAACSAILHQSLTSAPGSWQPQQLSYVMQLIHSIAAAPSHSLVNVADALGIVHQAIRDADRLGSGPVMLTDAIPAAELYRQPLVAALGLFIAWGGSGNVTSLSCSYNKAVPCLARGRACTAALQLAGSIGLILVRQGRLTKSQAAEVLATAH
eukprot:8164-Heterococcus_DN1.PRE.27